MKAIYVLAGLVSLCFAGRLAAQPRCYDITDYGVRPDSRENAAPAVARAVAEIAARCTGEEEVVLRFPEGRYDFYEEGAAERTYYISNHDQTQPKRVGIALEGVRRLTLDGCGSEFVFHGRMLPVALVGAAHCRLRDFSIEFATPHIAQVRIVANDPERGILFEPAAEVRWRITPDSLFEYAGEGWTLRPETGIAFESGTGRIVYNTADLAIPLHGVCETEPGRILAPAWRDARLVPGTEVAMRGYGRPAPGIFLDDAAATTIEGVTVHYAEGMGLLAQNCTDIELDGFGVHLRGVDDPRCFTTQADATHFSGCRGRIVSRNGLYEAMMDDAINVHGTYLKVVERLDDRTLVGRYMHGQSWGFAWGARGEEVQVVRAATMDRVGEPVRIGSIEPRGTATTEGAREFVVRFDRPLPAEVVPEEGYGLENLTRTPEVLFACNTVRNNRARGALFSTPRRVVVEENLFDHVSGAAILLCGDCNGWYETGACREVVIRRNRFVDALTSLFQFTHAVISICPEIPDLAGQRAYFHGGSEGGIVVEENVFDTFDAPILYAKSVDGLLFRRNTIRTNDDYPPFHWNRSRFLLERTANVRIEE